MGTANFGRLKLANRLWALAPDNSDDGEFEYEDTIENVKIGIELIEGVYSEDFYNGDNKVKGSFSIPFYNREKKEWEDNKYYIIVENGYYQGARFDIVEADEHFDDDAKVTKVYQKRLDKKIKEIEGVFEKYCTPLVKVAQFSNGEAIYEVEGSIGDILTR